MSSRRNLSETGVGDEDDFDSGWDVRTLLQRNRELQELVRHLKILLMTKEEAEQKRGNLEKRLHPSFPHRIRGSSPGGQGEAGEIAKLQKDTWEAQLRERDAKIEMLSTQLERANVYIRKLEIEACDVVKESEGNTEDDTSDEEQIGGGTPNGEGELGGKNFPGGGGGPVLEEEENNNHVGRNQEEGISTAEEIRTEEHDSVEPEENRDAEDNSLLVQENLSILLERSRRLHNNTRESPQISQETPPLRYSSMRIARSTTAEISSLPTPPSTTSTQNTLPLRAPVDYIPRYGKQKPVKVHGINKNMYANGRFYCFCKSSFKTRARLSDHLRYFTGDPKFPCEECPLRFTQLSLLKKHALSAHKTHLPGGTIGCGDCGVIFTDREAHKAHRLELHLHPFTASQRQREHAEDERFEEPRCKCGRTYARKTTLASHIRSYTNPHVFQCEVCPRRFKVLGQLHSHLRKVHKQEISKGDLGCGLCGEIFRVRKALQQHMRTAHGVLAVNQTLEDPSSPPREHRYRPCSPNSRQQGPGRFLYRCTCGSAFKSRKLLQCHITQRRPRVPFKCERCSGEFVNHTRLAKHLRETHKVKGYAGFGCSSCGTVWPTRVALRRHRDGMHGREKIIF